MQAMKKLKLDEEEADEAVHVKSEISEMEMAEVEEPMVETVPIETPQTLEALKLECKALFHEKNYHKALNSVDKRIAEFKKLYPDPERTHSMYYDCYNDRGICLDGMKEPRKAAAEYRRAIEIKIGFYGEGADSSVIHRNLALSLVKLHRYDEAHVAMKKAMDTTTDLELKITYTSTFLGISKLYGEQLIENARSGMKRLYDKYINVYGIEHARTIEFKKKCDKYSLV